MTDIPQEKTRVTIDDWLAMPEALQKIELINGELFMPPAPTDGHQSIAGNLYFILRRDMSNKGTFRLSPIDLKIGGHGLQPDIFWIAPDNKECVLVDGKYWQGAPDLVIEVLSPSTEKRDRSDKFKIYEVNGVREYWMIQPKANFVEVHTRKDDKFVQQGIYSDDETFESSTLQLEINIAPIFEF